MKVLISNIQWDTNGRMVKGLPTEITLTVDDGMDVGLEGADLLSDRYGWLVNSFCFERIDAEAVAA